MDHRRVMSAKRKPTPAAMPSAPQRVFAHLAFETFLDGQRFGLGGVEGPMRRTTASAAKRSTVSR
ncbi:MAG: hypothetical protein QM771_13905 [Nitrospira sp.]